MKMLGHLFFLHGEKKYNSYLKCCEIPVIRSLKKVYYES